MKWKASWAIRQGCIRGFLVSVKRELLSQLLVPTFIRLTEAQPPHPESPHHSGSLPKQPWPHSQTCLCLALLLCAPFWCHLLFFLNSVLRNSTHFQYSPKSQVLHSSFLGFGDSVKSKTQGEGMDIQLVLEHTAWVCTHNVPVSMPGFSVHHLTSLEKNRPWRWMPSWSQFSGWAACGIGKLDALFQVTRWHNWCLSQVSNSAVLLLSLWAAASTCLIRMPQLSSWLPSGQ